MVKECLYYDSELKEYWVLEIDIKGLTNKQIKDVAFETLRTKHYLTKEKLEKAQIVLVDTKDIEVM